MKDATDIGVNAKHIAIVMDGNNRWAKERDLPSLVGHRNGVNAVREVITGCVEKGVEALTLFAFSSENWRRPELEVKGLMDLFMFALEREVKKLKKHDIRLRIIGDRSRFSDKLQRKITEAELATASGAGLQLNIAANYGGRWDIVNAAQKLAQQVADGYLEPEVIDEQLFGEKISLADLPDPDLCIRTAGQQRISNFLLWQFAYTEFYYSDCYWPDFNKDALFQALEDFGQRERRFGKTSEQVANKAEKND